MTEDQIKTLIDHAAESLGHEWVQHGSGSGVADALFTMAKGEGNILGIAQALFQIGDALESISKTYARELDAKLEGEI
jgi:hypothetical protein